MEQITLATLTEFLKSEGVEPVTVPDRNYWFLRTHGGEFYEEFFQKNFIAIGWDDVPCISELNRTEEIIGPFKEKYGASTTRVFNQVHRFCREMQKGDIVIIPSHGSCEFAFGIIIDDKHHEAQDTQEALQEQSCPYLKRRHVKWITSVKRYLIDPKLYLFFRNQQALSNANDYKSFIERAINPFYIMNGVAYFNIAVRRREDIPSLHIPLYMTGLLERAVALHNIIDNDDEALTAVARKISTRVNVQCPGVIEYFGDPAVITAIAVIGILIIGGKLSFNRKPDGDINGEISTPGFLGRLIELIDKYFEYKKKSVAISDDTLSEVNEDLKIKIPRKRD
ncbi:MAG: hypothetical protein HUJ83_08245 [Veillonella sp.]|nr:hypothetical protein [Veillonella sp.]